MPSLSPITTLRYNLEFFKLFPSQPEEFTYYTFDDTPPPGFANYWNILGLRQRYKKNVLLFDIKLMHIGDDELSLEVFEALRDATSLLILNPAQLQGLIQFLEELVDQQASYVDHEPSYFHLVDTDELTGLHLPPWAIKRGVGDYYRYVPDEDIQDTEQINLVSLPHWFASSGFSQSSSLWFVTFHRSRLDDPAFQPLDIEGPGMMTFTQQTLHEFILLLKQRTYDTFVQASQA